ncbi:GTPase IMAP family member 9-like [Mya arenaria]|uniref:GTPase IMAP family member 9-like n=1 Tax=Mya arenaria TaxID=6604 RepID=UPI0022E41908|nr:GTPase IMAP family member 9-like [Mya arenaria]
MSNDMQEMRVVLIGKSGTGKSSTGNTLLGSKVFDAKLSFNAVTKECVEGRFVDHNKNLTYICVDTPGLFDSSDKLAETALKIQSSVTKHCHKPHAFLLVLEATRFNHEDCFTLSYLQMMFGKEICEHLIIVVTHGERFQSDDHFMKKLKENDPLWDFIKKCGGRVIRIENESNSKQTARENLEETIEKLSRNGKEVYSCKYLSTCSEALAESLANYKGPKDIDKQLQDIQEILKRKLPGCCCCYDNNL